MSLLGENLVRTDAMGKLTGEARYTVDYDGKDLLHGSLLRSSVPSGRIKALDTTLAESLPGVRCIVTAMDVPDTRAGWVLREHALFAREQVRYEGEPIAGVVADTPEQAKAAVAAIELNMEEMEAVGDMEAALAENAPLVHPEWKSYQTVSGEDHPRYGNIASELVADNDDVDVAFENADLIVEDEFISNRQYQAYIEPKSAVGIFREGRYIIHTGHQYPFNVRDRVAQYLDVRPSQVRVIGHSIGGGFGAKLDTGLEPYAAILSKFAGGRPVKLVNNRTEDMLTCPSRENAVIKIRSALDKQGNLLGRELICHMDNGAYSGEMVFMPSVIFHLAGSVYKVSNIRVIARLVYTNTAPTGAMRGVSGVYFCAMQERHMDNIADQLGVDRREYRLQNLVKSGDTLLNGQVLDDADLLRKGFEKMEETAPWTQLNKNKKPWHGIGIGAGTWITNSMPGSVQLKLNEDGSVAVVTGANDNGSGAVSMGVTQIVAEHLGLSADDIIVTMPDTDIAGYDGGSQGSRTTHIVGRAAGIAADELKRMIYEVASGMLEANRDDLEMVNGKVGVVGYPDSRIPLENIAMAATWGRGPLSASGSYTTEPVPYNPGCASGMLFPYFPTPTYHVHLAEVEVNPVTGNVRVVRYIVVQEVGRVINPTGVRGQIQGAVTQGIGHALYESLRIRNARYLERSLEAYRLPLAVDIPEVEVITMEHPHSLGPFGAKGVGEPAIILAPATIACAVSDAIGKPFNKIPISPEDVLEAIVDMENQR